MFGPFGSFQPTFEATAESYFHEERSRSSIYDDIAPSSTPVIQPRLHIAEPSDYIASGTPVLQPREREEEYFLATADSHPTHSQFTSEGQYRTTETLRGHPWPKTGRRPSDDASPTIRPQYDSTAYSITAESETTKPLLDQITPNEESEALQKSKDLSPKLTAETMKYTHDIKHTDDFGKDFSSHTDKNLVSNDFVQLNNKHKGQKIRFAESQSATSDQHKRDFSQQANLPRRKIKATSFQKRSVKDSK
ncbi:hypothetical protein CDAR_127951 [Caerostris darwini]|uniref:Uncharacterized protein n=1 Tax=Caerostris darwini TaxID=1538125 RepID=A0AAV4TY68_9ARAC|nr:hypothetical protein CDAR_127951 [Caerostris darwini]